MEKKVYEGYQRTSSKNTTSKSSATKKTVTSSKQTEKKTPAIMAGKSSVSKPRLAMFIDVDNVGINRENLLEILFYANGKYQIELCKLYGFSEDTLPGIRDIANEYNMVTVGRMKFKQTNTNCLDSRLLIDAYECALNNHNKIDMIFLWCYPCDLAELFEKIIGLGVNTATIDNSIFDCKNNFVSQTFKLYSPYNFSVGQSYGKVKNEPTDFTPSPNFETGSVAKSASDSISNASSSITQVTNLDDYVPPVLPRRTIVERSNPNATKTEPITETKAEIESNDKEAEEGSKSLVEEIARKLNIEMPNENEDEIDGTDNKSTAEAEASLFVDMLKKAGLDDLIEKKPLKYEDTIGDL